MALIARLPASEAAHMAARALEALVGHDLILTVGEPVIAEPAPALLPAGPTRSVALPFGNGIVGEITLVVATQFATVMEAATPDASLVSAALPALRAAAEAIEPVIHLQAVPEHTGEIATDTLLMAVVGDFAIVPLFETDDVVACVIVRVVDEATLPPVAAPVPPPAAALPAAPIPAVSPTPTAPLAVAAPAPAGPGVLLHEFQPLGEHGAGMGPPRPLHLLNDVKMQVIAELGRRRMKVRDLAELEPGSVIVLDRAAGSPVDVLVNGALLATGEVVVIDEEFGIRISEIIVGES
jgi:flagellar motor switch protein FliN/FliY